jgi:hypothetical protein
LALQLLHYDGMWPVRLVSLAWIATMALPGMVGAVRLDATATGSGAVGSQITYTVSFSPSSAVSGYDLTISWDPNELEFLSSSPIFGGAFAVAPTSAGYRRSRVANVIPVPAGVPAGNLFSVTFLVKPGFAQDGLANDFTVHVEPRTNGRGLAGPAGVVLHLDNPRGLAFDGLTLIPEPQGMGLAALLALAVLRVRWSRACRGVLRARPPRAPPAAGTEEA